MVLQNELDTKPILNTKLIKDRLNILSKEENISKWDIGASSSNDVSVQVYKAEAKQLKASQRSSVTLRVWNENEMIGITSTSDLSEKGLKKALISAKAASYYANENERPNFSPLSKSDIKVKARSPIKEFGVKKLYERLKQAESDLINKHKAIIDVPYNGFSEVNYERIYVNSDGAERYLNNTQSTLYLYAKAQEVNRKPRSSGSIKIAYSSNEIDIEKCIEEAAMRTISHLDYKPIKTNKYLICFKPEAFLDLIDSFSNLFNARSILDGVSLSNKDSIGKKLSSTLLNLNDNGLHKSNIGSYEFDGEGTPTQDICIIENGKLKNFIHSEATAKQFGVLPTGHAGLGAKVSVSTDWLVISRSKNGELSNNKLDHKNSNEEFVLIENLNALHAGIKPSQGSFSLPFDGWHVKNGIKRSIESATVAGDIRAVLKGIIDIEEKQIETHSGVSPHVWVEELSITGE